MLPIVAVVVWGGFVPRAYFFAVILHPKGKALDGASISFREEQRLDAPHRTGFPEMLPFGMGQLLTKANFNPP